MQPLFDNAAENIQRFNRCCLHYNLVANAIYRERRRTKAPFSPSYLPYIVAGLISFDIQRMMGRGIAQKYDSEAGGFASRLRAKLVQVQPFVGSILDSDLIETDMESYASDIEAAYEKLASGGKGALNARGRRFDVGATKVLHFLNPELFMIIDPNAARALRTYSDIPYRKSGQPGYSSARYVASLAALKELIVQYGVERFRRQEPDTPLTRIFDKIVFARGALS